MQGIPNFVQSAAIPTMFVNFTRANLGLQVLKESKFSTILAKLMRNKPVRKVQLQLKYNVNGNISNKN